MRTKILTAAALVVLMAFTIGCAAQAPESTAQTKADTSESGVTLETRIGKLSFTHDFATGYPTDETIDLAVQ